MNNVFSAIADGVTEHVAAHKLLTALGFEQDANGQYQATGCRVLLYRVGGEWEIDIVATTGAALGMDVPVGKIGTEIDGKKLNF